MRRTEGSIRVTARMRAAPSLRVARGKTAAAYHFITVNNHKSTHVLI
jgi:hypothetical protein